MNTELKKYGLSNDVIEKIVGAQSHLLRYPVPIIKLSKELGIESVEKTMFDKKISGEIRLINGGYFIRTNKTESRKRRRFTIAHELSHFLLHKEKVGNGITENTLYRSNLSTQDEVEANRLAADILMPSEQIQKHIDEVSSAIGDLAETFDVSVSAMTVRLGIPSVLNAL